MAVTWAASKGASLIQLMDELYDSRQQTITAISVAKCDPDTDHASFPYPRHDRHTPLVSSKTTDSSYLDACYRFFIRSDGNVYGYVDAQIASSMPWTDDFLVDNEKRTVTLSPGLASSLKSERRDPCMAALSHLLELAKQNPSPLFDYLRTGWRDEKMRIVGCQDDIEIERAGLAYFGLIGPGVHLNLLTLDPATNAKKFWMQRRSATVKNYPGMLDSTVAGGITAGLDPLNAIIKESAEEAGLHENILKSALKPVGMVSHWFFLTQDRTLNQPTLNYVFELEVGPDVVPRGVDGEASGFELLSLAELKTALLEGKVKPAAAAVSIDLLIRHGELSQRDDGYEQLCARVKRLWPMPMRSI